MDITEEIKGKMQKGLTIGRIPSKTYESFVTLAKEDFCDDYGLCLKYLIDVRTGLMPLQGEELNQELERLNTEIEAIKARLNEKKKEENGRVMLDGTRR